MGLEVDQGLMMCLPFYWDLTHLIHATEVRLAF
jgi:hypothetical protein